jgi:hypothetical protein
MGSASLAGTSAGSRGQAVAPRHQKRPRSPAYPAGLFYFAGQLLALVRKPKQHQRRPAPARPAHADQDAAPPNRVRRGNGARRMRTPPWAAHADQGGTRPGAVKVRAIDPGNHLHPIAAISVTKKSICRGRPGRHPRAGAGADPKSNAPPRKTVCLATLLSPQNSSFEKMNVLGRGRVRSRALVMLEIVGTRSARTRELRIFLPGRGDRARDTSASDREHRNGGNGPRCWCASRSRPAPTESKFLTASWVAVWVRNAESP